jgi:hypothetical protein
MVAAGVDPWIHVNNSAAVPTTSTSMTMPFRKNFGFNRSLRVERATTVRRRWVRV